LLGECEGATIFTHSSCLLEGTEADISYSDTVFRAQQCTAENKRGFARLYLKVERAAQLPPVGTTPFGGVSMDPYVIVECTGHSDPDREAQGLPPACVGLTEIVGGTTDPEWNQYFVFEVPHPNSIVRLTLMDSDIGGDTKIGAVVMPIASLYNKKKVVRGWWHMEPRDEFKQTTEYVGRLRLEWKLVQRGTWERLKRRCLPAPAPFYELPNLSFDDLIASWKLLQDHGDNLHRGTGIKWVGARLRRSLYWASVPETVLCLLAMGVLWVHIGRIGCVVCGIPLVYMAGAALRKIYSALGKPCHSCFAPKEPITVSVQGLGARKAQLRARRARIRQRQEELMNAYEKIDKGGKMAAKLRAQLEDQKRVRRVREAETPVYLSLLERVLPAGDLRDQIVAAQDAERQILYYVGKICMGLDWEYPSYTAAFLGVFGGGCWYFWNNTPLDVCHLGVAALREQGVVAIKAVVLLALLWCYIRKAPFAQGAMTLGARVGLLLSWLLYLPVWIPFACFWDGVYNAPDEAKHMANYSHEDVAPSSFACFDPMWKFTLNSLKRERIAAVLVDQGWKGDEAKYEAVKAAVDSHEAHLLTPLVGTIGNQPREAVYFCDEDNTDVKVTVVE